MSPSRRPLAQSPARSYVMCRFKKHKETVRNKHIDSGNPGSEYSKFCLLRFLGPAVEVLTRQLTAMNMPPNLTPPTPLSCFTAQSFSYPNFQTFPHGTPPLPPPTRLMILGVAKLSLALGSPAGVRRSHPQQHPSWATACHWNACEEN